MSWSTLKKSVLLSTTFFVFSCIPLFSLSPLNETQALYDPNGFASDNFGTKVSISGDTALVGSPLSDPESRNLAGIVYVYKLVNGSWVQQQKLTAPTVTAFQRFGKVLSLSGDTALIGPSASATGQGQVYVYKKDSNGQFVYDQILTASDGEPSDNFGRSIDFDGHKAIIGSFNLSAYIFVKDSNGQWSQEAKLVGSDTGPFDDFGFEVAINSNMALVSDPVISNGSLTRAGAAYLFVKNENGDWIEEAKLTPSDPKSNANYGYGLALSEDRAFVGSTQASSSQSTLGQGAIYAFKKIDGVWTQEQKLLTSDFTGNSNLGTSLSFDSGVLVGGDTSRNAAYVFRYRNGLWRDDEKLSSLGGISTSSNFGNSVSIDNNVILVGAYLSTVGSNIAQGKAFIFSFDSDYDGILNSHDNCPFVPNPDQLNTDGQGQGDACDSDDDNDGVLDVSDNCPLISNADQLNADGDAFGDACDPDDDNDGILDGSDNCPFVANPGQEDSDGDGAGNLCDDDLDGDGVLNDQDNCPLAQNPLQEDVDQDNIGDACDLDNDNDGVADADDNCDFVANPGQEDLDGDNIGDACDADTDGDGFDNAADNCPLIANPGQDDADSDGLGNLCDPDDDNDGINDGQDNCPFVANPGQEDSDNDSIGNACDPDYQADADGDGYPDSNDNCPNISNSDQNNFDGDAFGDVCDSDVDGDGVANGQDLCAQTPLGSIVDPASGCTINQLVPCNGPYGTTSSWKNHGQYVSTIGVTIKNFYKLGLITAAERDALQAQAAESSCGKK